MILKITNLPPRRDGVVPAVLVPKRLLAVPVLPNKLVVEVGAAVEVFPNENAIPWVIKESETMINIFIVPGEDSRCTYFYFGKGIKLIKDKFHVLLNCLLYCQVNITNLASILSDKSYFYLFF